MRLEAKSFPKLSKNAIFTFLLFATIKTQLFWAEDLHALRINEILAQNKSFLFPAPPRNEPGDPEFSTPDLVEIYNPTDRFLSLEGLYLTDSDPQDPQQGNLWRFPRNAWIPPKGYLTVLLGGREVEGQLRASFRLERSGERIALLAEDMKTVIDEVVFPCQLPDVSYARIPDGSGDFFFTSKPTFCWPNENEFCTCRGSDPGGGGEQSWCPEEGESPSRNVLDEAYPPDLDILDYFPLMPAENEEVKVTVSVSCHDTEVDEVKIEYRLNESEDSLWVDCKNKGRPPADQFGGRAPTYNIWEGIIPGQKAGTRVAFKVHARRGDSVDVEPDKVWIVFTAGRELLPPLRITEVMASNLTTLADNEGEYDDWVEITNTGSEDVDLGGFFLTDNRRRPHKWQFPEGLVLRAGERVIVWCDGQTFQSEEGFLHTNFKLNAGGDDVCLADQGGIFQRITWDRELEDISLGFTEPEGVRSHFLEATPGEKNPSGLPPVISSFSPEGLSSQKEVEMLLEGENLDTVNGAFLVTVEESPEAGTVLHYAPLPYRYSETEKRLYLPSLPACSGGSDSSVVIAADRLACVLPLPCSRPFLRGAVNDDDRVNLADVLALLGFLFGGRAGTSCQDRMDVNDDGRINLADALYLLAYIFGGGPEPPEPFTEEAVDPSPDQLKCRAAP